MYASQSIATGVGHVLVRAARNTASTKPLVGRTNGLRLIRHAEAVVFHEEILQALDRRMGFPVHRENRARHEVLAKWRENPGISGACVRTDVTRNPEKFLKLLKGGDLREGFNSADFSGVGLATLAAY